MLLEQSARLEVKWYVNMIIALVSHSVPNLMQRYSGYGDQTPSSVVERVLSSLVGSHTISDSDRSLQYLIQHRPELLCLSEPWRTGNGRRTNLKMDEFRALMVPSLYARVEGLPLRINPVNSESNWAQLVAESLRYNTRYLGSSPLLVSDEEVLRADILAVCSLYGVKQSMLTSSDVDPASAVYPKYSTMRRITSWLQEELGQGFSPALRAFMHFMANPCDYSLGGHVSIAGKQKLLASYQQRASLSVEEEAAGYVSGIEAMDTYSHPMRDLVVSDRAKSCGVTCSFYEILMEYGADKVHAALLDVEELYSALPALSLAPALDEVKPSDEDSRRFYVRETESAALILAIAADPSVASLVLPAEQKEHPLISTFLRMAQSEGPERALPVAHSVLRRLGMAGRLADLSVLKGKETDLAAVTEVADLLRATAQGQEEG